jgi:hypothetical protein
MDKINIPKSLYSILPETTVSRKAKISPNQNSKVCEGDPIGALRCIKVRD